LLLANFAPWLITPLLMLGGSYLCFEGAEKIFHVLFPHGSHAIEKDMDVRDPGHLEEQKVKGAIKTDFILSAEIMTIALAAIEAPNVWMQAATLAVVGLGVTVAVYGSVALIVKMDDVGLYLAGNALTPVGRGLGRGLVKAMPTVMKTLSIVGTAAMLWVGGSIVIHGMEVLGFGWLGHHIHDWAYAVGHSVSAQWEAAAEWIAKATMDGIFGLAWGMVLIPLATKVIGPVMGAFSGSSKEH
jgi:predicted DNA repair protein MutK